MRTVLVTGSDTGAGKTHVVATLARLLAADGSRVQIVKVVETGRTPDSLDEGDALQARRLCGAEVAAFTLVTFPAPLSPPIAAKLVGQTIDVGRLLAGVTELAPCDWRILEGAGGIATPLDEHGFDWADFAEAVGADATIVVVPNRLGAINQARLAFARAKQMKLHAGVWLNATFPVGTAVVESNRESLSAVGVPVWAEQAYGELAPLEPAAVKAKLFALEAPVGGISWLERCDEALAERTRLDLRRVLHVTSSGEGMLNLADNDYLALARDLAVVEAVVTAAREYGTSASASPLITGWRTPHAQLVERLCAWHGFPFGLIWSSGYAANSAVLGVLPKPGDVVLADRLVHHSMIAGLLRSGARLRRYEHLRLDRLEAMLTAEREMAGRIFVVTESVFSMDGDFPDLAGMAELKRRYGFCWIVDEAHGLGWYGPEGAGLVRDRAVERDVDVLVGTLGKTLASGGAYTLFRQQAVRDYLVNTAGEFIYSTGVPPTAVAAASAALNRVRELAPLQNEWRAASRKFREDLQREGWAAPAGDSPIVPVRLDTASAAMSLAASLKQAGILVAAVRPPTVPAGTSRLRFSLKRTVNAADHQRVLSAMQGWRAAQ
jgi:8-amino-7-oxononanoate synthase